MEITIEHIQAFMWGAGGTILKALIIVVLTGIAAKGARKVMNRLLIRDGSLLPSSSIFTNIVNVAVWACGLSIMLSSCFSFDLSAAVTALGVGGIAISLGCQDTISNLVGGLQVSLAGTVTPGDFIEVAGKRGIVRDVNWRYTRIETLAGEIVIVPNAAINSQSVTHLPPITCVKVPLRIWNTAKDLNVVSKEILAAVKDQVVGLVVDAEKNTPRVVFGDISDYTFGATLSIDVEEGVDYVMARDQALRAVAPFIVPEGSNSNE